MARIIRVQASQYQDYDNCLEAAAADVAEDMGLEAGEASATWEGGEDGERDIILVEVPGDDPNPLEACATLTGEQIRHGSFGPIVWDMETGDTRMATQNDMDTLPVGDDLTPEEEENIED